MVFPAGLLSISSLDIPAVPAVVLRKFFYQYQPPYLSGLGSGDIGLHSEARSLNRGPGSAGDEPRDDTVSRPE